MIKKAIYPGTFDPLTNGHIDILERSARLFDHIVLAIAHSSEKKTLFSLDERVYLAKKATSFLPNVEVLSFDTLTVDFAKKQKISVLIRGIRTISDFEYEQKLAYVNRQLFSSLETIFLLPSENASFISSSLVKEMAKLGGDIKNFVSEPIYKALVKKLN